MSTDEKEYSNYLFDQLYILEDIEEVAKIENATETLEIIEKNANRLSGSFTSHHR